MSQIQMVSLHEVDLDAFLKVLNDKAVRHHLVDHDLFTPVSLKVWINEKIEVDAQPGCRVRAVMIDGHTAGWCGLQPDAQGVELAIVLSQAFWGVGRSIFSTLMRWAKELGHKEVLIHLLDSRARYRSLTQMASKVESSHWNGRQFTTYFFTVGD